VINQPNTTFHDNNIFNTTTSISQAQAQAFTPSLTANPPPGKDPPIATDVIQKIADIQIKIDKLSTQLKETELKDSIREQRLQSVLVAKQK